MKDVTIEEVQAAAQESTLAAVRCSMRHWLCNASITEWSQLNSVQCGRCALCLRCGYGIDNSKHLLPSGELCPLKETSGVCCQEWSKASMAVRQNNIEVFKEATNALYVRLAKIEHDLMQPEKKEEKKEEVYEGGRLFKIGEYTPIHMLVWVGPTGKHFGMITPDGKHWGGSGIAESSDATVTASDIDKLCGKGKWEALPKTAKLVVQDENKNS